MSGTSSDPQPKNPVRRLLARPRRLVLLGVVAIGVVGWWISSALGDVAEIPWTAAGVEDLVIGVEVEGTLASRDSSRLTPPQIPGRWDFKIGFMAPEGVEVAAGEPVLGFDTTELGRRLLALQNEAEKAVKNIEKLDADQSQSLMGLELQLAEAEAKLGKAELQHDVPDDLRSAAEGEKTGLDVELAKMEVESLTGQLEAARASGKAQREALVAQRQRAERLVRQTQDSIGKMMVMAPRAGTVIYVTNWRDEKKKVGDSVWRMERILELPNLSTMLARGEVDEADAGRVEEGQAVSLRLDAHPDIEFTARIESIWRTVQRKRNSRNPLKIVRLDLALDQTDTERMRPGMRFRGTVEAERLEDVLVIPVHTVFPSEQGPIVYRRTLMGFEPVPVQLGRRNSSSVQVIEGLFPGDRVAEVNPGQ